MKIISYKGMVPDVINAIFIADGARIIGNVKLSLNSSIWFNAVLRADISPIIIGKETNIQDNATIHVESDTPAIVGNRVTVGHNAILHACKIEDNVLIGMGAIILNGAHISKNSLIAAGAVVTENKFIPENSLVMGVPARVVRELTKEEVEQINLSAIHYLEVAKNYTEEVNINNGETKIY